MSDARTSPSSAGTATTANTPRIRRRWRRGFSAPIDTRAQAWLHGSRRIRQDWPGHLALLALIAFVAVVVATALLARR